MSIPVVHQTANVSNGYLANFQFLVNGVSAYMQIRCDNLHVFSTVSMIVLLSSFNFVACVAASVIETPILTRKTLLKVLSVIRQLTNLVVLDFISSVENQGLFGVRGTFLLS